MAKVCAGRGCGKKGIHILTVIHLNREGWFCDSCKNNLVSEGLIVESKGTWPQQQSHSATSHQNPIPAPTSDENYD